MLETCRNVNPDYFTLLLFTKCVNPIYSGMRNTTSVSPFNFAMSALIWQRAPQNYSLSWKKRESSLFRQCNEASDPYFEKQDGYRDQFVRREKYFAQRKEASVSMKEQDWLYEKKTLPLFSSERIETRHDQIVTRKTEAFFPLSLYWINVCLIWQGII